MNQVFLYYACYFYFTNMVKFQTLFARVLLAAQVLFAMVNFIYADRDMNQNVGKNRIININNAFSRPF